MQSVSLTSIRFFILRSSSLTLVFCLHSQPVQYSKFFQKLVYCECHAACQHGASFRSLQKGREIGIQQDLRSSSGGIVTASPWCAESNGVRQEEFYLLFQYEPCYVHPEHDIQTATRWLELVKCQAHLGEGQLVYYQWRNENDKIDEIDKITTRPRTKLYITNASMGNNILSYIPRLLTLLCVREIVCTF